MKDSSKYKLVFKNEIYTIPTDFKHLDDVNIEVHSSLMETYEYHVQSVVSDEVFHSFIDYWFKNKIPKINNNNISQFESLSNEFNLMANLIKTFKRKAGIFSFFSMRNNEIENKIKTKFDILHRKKNNYQKSIEILFQNNFFSTNSNISEYKQTFFLACEIGDIQYANLLMAKKICQNDIIYLINEEEKTAGVFSSLSKDEDIFIPRSIEYGNEEYIVTRIIRGSFQNSQKVNSIQFPENSELKIIEKYSFSNSSLRSILIPSHVTRIEEEAFSYCKHLKKVEFQRNSEIQIIEKRAFSNSYIKTFSIPSSIEFQESCFNGTSKLTDIQIFKNKEENIKYYDDSFIIGKSSPNQENFDVLLLARRDIEKVVIPSFIKRIDSNSFSNCVKIKSFEFSPNSQLSSIGSFAFSNSSISSFSIPISCSSIENHAFLFCKSLKKVEFKEGSKINVINESVFSSSALESISLPSNIVEFKERCFDDLSNLKEIKIFQNKEENIKFYDNSFIIGKSSPNQENFDDLILARRDIEKVVIPSFIKRIRPQSFQKCTKLHSIEFEENSQLTTIEENAFTSTSIRNISFPSSVVSIGIFSFSYCKCIQKVEFSKDSNLMSIQSKAFSDSSIESITIPSSLIEICDNAFNSPNLNEIKIIQKKKQNFFNYNDSLIIGKSSPNQENFDAIIFARKNIETAIVPTFVKKILSFSFFNNTSLKKIEFIQNSELAYIGQEAFSLTSIESIQIPSSVEIIDDYCFNYCQKLEKVEFKEDSKIKKIGEFAFANSSLMSISLPSSVELEGTSFINTNKLTNIKIFTKSEENISLFENSFIVAKSSSQQKNFDTLFVARRDIKEAFVPSFIREISYYAFNGCKRLKKVVFDENSELESISQYAFAHSSIDCIAIPQNVTKIDDYAFFLCSNLKVVEIHGNLNLENISAIFNSAKIVMIHKKK